MLAYAQVAIAGSEDLSFNDSSDLSTISGSSTFSDSSIVTNSAKFKHYLKQKYKEIYDVDTQAKQTQYGPSGSIYISGEIVPKEKINLPAEADKHGRARAIAKAFLEDEAELFGIVNLNEVRERLIDTSRGYYGEYVEIYYRRYINNVELAGSYIHVTVLPNESITGVMAYLVAVPPEVYEATKKKTLSEEEIKEIVLTNMNKSRSANEAEFTEKSHLFRKMAVTYPPYVIWSALGTWSYIVNAFTGEIIEKKSQVIIN
jgi:hypothetical protein